MQSIRCDPCQRGIVESNDTIGLLYQSLDGQDGVVRLYYDIGRLFVVGEDRVRLDELLGEVFF